MNGRSAHVVLGGSCELQCSPCDCPKPGRAGRLAHDRRDLERLLAGGGRRVVLRGAASGPLLSQAIATARAEGFGEVVVRTHAFGFGESGRADALGRSGADAVLVPLFSHVPKVHDAIAGKPDALVSTLAGLRALERARLAIEIEVPLLPARLQRLTDLVDLARRSVPTLRRVRFFVPTEPQPAALAPPPWTEGSERLTRALRHCRSLDVEVRIDADDGIPICALAAAPDLLSCFRFDPKKKLRLGAGFARPNASCGRCAVRRHCAGVAPSYASANGSAGLAAFGRRPAELSGEPSSGPIRGERERQAASRAEFLVLRPTVNCNQDCVFCSANETSDNVWADPDAMRRKIARAARRGIQHISFSGGEPTLTRELASYIEVASRLGVPKIEIVTNGVLLDSERRVQSLVDVGLTHAFVSLHAHSEELSRAQTAKIGDFARTVRAIELLESRAVKTVVNHVLSSINHRYVERFVEFCHERFGGRVLINFAFITPQYRALDNRELVPRLSDVMPFLRRAMRRALELGQPFNVGSRQGVPPCLLGEFRAWSDVLYVANAARSEDPPQKVRAPGCGQCRYTDVCNGVWRPYAERYGVGELRPVSGAPYDEDDVRAFHDALWRAPWGVPRSFEEVPELVRDRDAEARALDPVEIPRVVSLPLLPVRSRPLRLAMLGSGRRARLLARAALDLGGITLDAVASPNAPDADLTDFGRCPVFREAQEALDDTRPEAVVVAAATHAHLALGRMALERGIPVLIEKPLAVTLEQAEELTALARERSVLLAVVHNLVFSPGISPALDANRGDVAVTRRCSPASADAPAAWHRGALWETLYHPLALVTVATGGAPLRISELSFFGGTRPERIRARLEHSAGQVDLLFDFSAERDELELARRDGSVWRRSGREVSLAVQGRALDVERRGSELHALIDAFRKAVLGEGPLRATGDDGVATMRATEELLRALEAAGAPLRRPGAPKHVASPQFRERP